MDRRVGAFRGRVLAAAGELFDEKGVDATKLDDICEAADVAKRTLCNHFPTKGDIVRALSADAIEAQVALFDSARSRGRTTRERLSLVFENLRALPRRHVAAHQRELLGEFFRAGHTGVISGNGASLISDALIELLRAGKAGELPAGCSAETFAEVVLGTISQITLGWIRREDYDIDAHLQSAAEFLVGLLPLSASAES